MIDDMVKKTIGLLVFIVLIGVIAVEVATGANLSGGALALFTLIPLLLVAGVIKKVYK